MTDLRLSCAAAWGEVRRELQILMSYRLRFVMQVLATFFSVALFYYVSRLVSVSQFHTHEAYFAFVVVGLALMEVLAAALHTVPNNLRSELVAGTFERMVVSPFGPLGGIVSLSLFPMLLALVLAAITIAIAALLFGLPVQWSTAPLALPVVALGLLAFLPIALLLAGTVMVVKQVNSLTNLVISGMTLAGGALFPPSLLPHELRWIADVQPLTPALALTRHELVGAAISGSPWLAIAKLAGFAVVLGPLSILVISRAIKICQRRGTLIEY